ncbi:hypothetical protein F2981_11990 [Sinorhizobium meliloti]|nr:hypothetical protein [Sinorhizobium meliloti]
MINRLHARSGKRERRDERQGQILWTGSPDTAACAATARRIGHAGWFRESSLTVDDLIWPIFVVPGSGIAEPSLRCRRQPHERRQGGRSGQEAAGLGIPGYRTFPISTWRFPRPDPVPTASMPTI